MDVQDNSESVTLSAASHSGMKRILLVVGISGLAILGAAVAKYWQPIEVVAGAMAHNVFAVGTRGDQADGTRGDQADQTTADSSRRPASAPDAPAATPVEPSADPAPALAERLNTVSPAPDTPAAGLFGVGDRLKIVFYERVDVEEDKWGRMSPQSALRGIQQRPELSGEYTVQEDGTISVPLLGSLPIANRSPQRVQADLVEMFDRLLGRKGVVNILSVERSPIYVLGPVKSPGSFKYVPGMTILHAIALAGGLDRNASEPWQKIEAVREIQRRSGSAQAMLKLLARGAVLKAERDGTEPEIPLRLLEMVGATEAANLVHQESDRRKPFATARKNRERAILTGLETAKQDVAVYGRMESLDELVKLRQDRVNSMRALVDRNVISMTVMNQVQSELTDAEQRKRDALNQLAMAKQRLASMEAEALRVQADLKNDLEVEIDTIERQVADDEREFNTSESVLKTLPATRANFTKEASRLTYKVVRQTAAGPVSIASTGMTVLQPGDLVNIITGEGEPREQAGAAVSTSPAREKLPAGCSANGTETSRAVADQGTK